ncbi:OPT super [Coemansia sp. RSA 2337]|nr:OPT super [Coemansia sp. S16]KAJ2070432.1 OPT super [Coemansia sp. S155-1]KAJ2347305.1 OPT super [Coemansia sp. RSA 2673]KAJ2464433.1 OPT super [Coemansia sp. RSA 2337]
MSLLIQPRHAFEVKSVATDDDHEQRRQIVSGRHMVDVSQPQFTWRAIIVGLLFGTILCFSNLWFGLQSGWISMMSLQSSLVGFAVFKALEHVLDVPFGPAENVVLQSTAVATATMPLAGGFVGILPALKLLEESESNGARTVLNFGQLCAWGLALTFFGVFFAIPLRRQTIIKEKLRFPSGTATAQMISVLHKRPDPTLVDEQLQAETTATALNGVTRDHGTFVRRRGIATAADNASDNSQEDTDDEVQTDNISVDDVKWVTKLLILFVSFTMSGVYALLAHFFPIIAALPVFGRRASTIWAWNLMPSLSYAGQGIIMGLPTCIWMLVGSVVGWGILSPLAKNEGWAPGPVTDWKTGSRGWILWISLAVMIAESIVSLGLVGTKELLLALGRLRVFYGKRKTSGSLLSQPPEDVTTPNTLGQSVDGDTNVPKTVRLVAEEDLDEVDPRFLVPAWVTWGGLFASTLLCMGIVKALFDIPMYDTLIAVVLALPLAVLGVRALGETDLNPVSGIGKVSQVVFAGIMPGNLVGNLVAGGIAEAGAQQAGDLMQDLKTGHLLNASPRAQFVAQMIGSVFSVFVTAGAYLLYNKVYPIPGPQFPVPTAQVWLDMARLVNGHPLPPHVWPFIVAFSILFALLPAIAVIVKNSGKEYVAFGPWTVRTSTLLRWWPSGIAFAIGIYNTPNFTLMRVIGALSTAVVTEVVVSRHKHSGIRSDVLRDHDESILRRKIAMLAIILASGFVLGEGTFSFFILLSQAF